MKKQEDIGIAFYLQEMAQENIVSLVKALMFVDEEID